MLARRIAIPHAEFAPPRPGGKWPALTLALLIHAVLLGMLAAGVTWQQEDKPGLTVQAELWANVPRLGSPIPAANPAPPPPAPELPSPAQPRTEAKPQPEPPPDTSVRDAQIALERQAQAAKAEAAIRLQHEREQRERLKQAAEKKRADDEAALAAQKAKATADTAAKLAADQAEKKKQVLAKAEQVKAEQLSKAAEKQKQEIAQKKAADDKKRADDEQHQAVSRNDNMARIARLAGIESGSANGGSSNGNGNKASGDGRGASMSASYGAKVAAKLRPNIVYTEEIIGNPETVIEVRATSDGTILSRKITKSSGNTAWDDAVLNAIDKASKLPPDVDGRYPTYGTITFRPKD